MAIIQKTLFPENLEKYNTFVRDTETNSKYFKITELPDTLTGGKNAFLIQGSQYLVPDTLIKIEIKDSQGNIIYHEPGEGYFSSSFNDVNGKPIITEVKKRNPNKNDIIFTIKNLIEKLKKN